VNGNGRVQAHCVAMLAVVPNEERLRRTHAASIDPNRPGRLGRHFSVLNRASPKAVIGDVWPL